MSPWIKLRKIMLQYFAESRWYTIVGATALLARALLLLLGRRRRVGGIDHLHVGALLFLVCWHGARADGARRGRSVA